MPVELTTPIVAPALAEVTYPYVWFTMIQINAPDPNKDADVYVKGFPFRVLEDGSRELNTSSPANTEIIGLFSQSEFDAGILGSVGAALAGATLPQLLGAAQMVLFAALDAQLKADIVNAAAAAAAEEAAAVARAEADAAAILTKAEEEAAQMARIQAILNQREPEDGNS